MSISKQYSLKELRSREKLTQKELAEKLNLSISTIAMYETGARVPRLIKAREIADYFEVSLDEIFFGSKPHETGV